MEGSLHSPELYFREKEGVTIPQADRTYPYFLNFDSESYFQSDCPQSTSSIVWEVWHVQGFKQPTCSVNHRDPVHMTQDCMHYMLPKLRQHYQKVIDQLQWMKKEAHDQLKRKIAKGDTNMELWKWSRMKKTLR